ncbi:alpha/beta hydrolase [Mucilaginibacter angelicae]|uniref:Alpha/beta hydrolase n=1 Tax=Mucilaginibacter angelicae TaxID=869718 RepID=A0ABV6KYU5_9SPHI
MKRYILFLLLACIAICARPKDKATKLYSLTRIDAANPDSFIYRRAGKVSLKAYVFRPATGGKHPAILLFHGGAWRLGEAAWTFGRAKEFADKGIVAIAIDYRLANNGLSPIDGVEDACAAFAWVRAQAKTLGIDTKRVAGYGVSAGGHLVAATALIPAVNGKKISDAERPNALLLYSPALNMAPDPYFNGLMKGKGDPAAYSPSAYITRKLPPTLIIQGERDSIVYTKDAIAFRDEAVKAGAKCTLYVYPGVGHLLTRNLKIQYKDFDSDPAYAADAHQREDDFLTALGYMKK